MPAFNAEKYVDEAIKSIVEQSYENWELLVCDDASSDGTLQKIKDWEKNDSRIKVFSNDENIGKPKTVQFLVGKADGALFTFHDADDISFSERFRKLVNAFIDNPDVYLFGHNIERISEDGKRLGVFREKKSDFSEIVEDLKEWNSDGDPSVMMRKEVVDSLDWIYRPYFPNSMDYDLILRVTERFKTSNLLEVLSLYRNVPTSISKNVISNKKFAFPEMSKFFAHERKTLGVDSLQSENWDVIRKQEDKVLEPFNKDKTLHLRKMAEFFMSVKMNKSAIVHARKALAQEPFKLANIRCYQYCLRKSIGSNFDS